MHAELLTTTPVQRDSISATRDIVPCTAPRPILGTRDQPALYWVTVHVIQLFHQFLLAVNVEVVVPVLPEGGRGL